LRLCLYNPPEPLKIPDQDACKSEHVGDGRARRKTARRQDEEYHLRKASLDPARSAI
jgi:hypothetical protein